VRIRLWSTPMAVVVFRRMTIVGPGGGEGGFS
jgi:hypothetical protein